MFSGLPEDVRTFVVEHIDSVEQLEVLLLARSQPHRQWTAEEMANELRIDPFSATHRLDDLCREGLLDGSPEGSVRYEPKSDALRRAVDAVARSYASHRVAVISLIFSRPTERIRSFADAFRLRREDSDG